ncbi:MAG: peptidylprolyl isomerase [Bacteroidetes bacterium]|nr:MAG: peptidylprolyl isomerase [Bacteroidota bacterium]
MRANYNIKIVISIVLIGFMSSITLNSFSQKVIDRIVATVGSNEILYSDIENQYMQYLMQGYTSDREGIRCQIFEEILFAKLLLNQAQLDSVVVSDDMVESEMDRRLQYFISQIGSQEKLEEYYHKSILAIKSDLRSTIHEQMLSEQVKNQITSDVKITPSEVRAFYNAIPEDSIPLISSEYKYSHIIVMPEILPEEKEYAKHKLEGIRKRIIDGASFSSMARMYSEDPGSSVKGGELGDFGRGVMYPEFEAIAFSLEPGEVSELVETEAGFHIMELIKRKGDFINVRHILIMTKVSPVSMKIAEAEIDSVYQLIQDGTITFEEAALRYSIDDSRFNGGVALNPQTGGAVFSAESIDKELFFKLDKMNVGELLPPFLYMKERNKKAFRIIRLDKRTKPHKASLEMDYDKIQKIALEDKKGRAIGNWITDKTDKTFINVMDKDLKSCNFTYKWDQE